MFRLSVQQSRRLNRATLRACIGALALCAGLGLATGCGSDSSESDEKAGGDKPITVRMGWAPAADPLLLTLVSNGSLERNGLNVKLVKFQSGIPQVAALTKGDLDFGYMSGPPLISLGAQDVGIRAFAISCNNSEANGLVVPGDSDAKSIADLKGKTIGTLVGSTLEFALDEMLKSGGLSRKDVKIVNLPPPSHPAAFKSGDLDAVYTSQTPLLRLVAEGARVLERESSVPSAGIAGVNYYVARGDFLEKNPEAARRFLAAVQETTAEVAKNREAVVARLKQQTGVTDAEGNTLAEQVKVVTFAEQLDPAYPYNMKGGVQKALTPVVDFMSRLGQIKRKVDTNTLFEAKFVEEVASED